MKRFISMLLALVMCVGMITQVLAINVGESAAEGTLVPVEEESEMTPEEIEIVGDYTEGVVLFALKKAEYLSVHEEVLASLGITNVEPLFTEDGEATGLGSSALIWYRAETTGDLAEIVGSLVALDGVVYAEPEYIYETEAYGEPSTTEISASWAYDNLHKQNGKHWWKELDKRGIAPGTGTVVAVIDTGVDYTHEDLSANMWVNTAELYGTEGVDDDGNGYIDDIYGADMTATGAKAGNPMDDHGHGTHVAGIIGMTANNIGGVGIAYGAKIMAIKAGYSTGSFSSTAIAKAINYAHMMGADVINMSFGGESKSYLVEQALEDAFGDCVLVAAAGNYGLPTTDSPDEPNEIDIFPAGYTYVIGVMASDSNGYFAGFSNWDYRQNYYVEYEIVAPGVSIYSTLPGDNYAEWSGTSMATPMVAAAAAILRSYYDDKDAYSSRFIMGQLVSATEDTCAGYPALNIFDSIDNLPKPNIAPKDLFLLDNVGDENGLNDGDGIIDAGETIDLGVLIRNQWGQTGEITVKVDAISDGGVPNPYVTFITDEVTLQPAGTFSEVDNGFVWNDSYLESVSDPIRFIVSPDTPNDTEIRLTITATTTNGYDLEDETIYYGYVAGTNYLPAYYFRVQAGRSIKGTISEDMTLTNDYLWIVENSVYIPEGVTVTVEPGTKIQFYSSEYDTAYASAVVPYINNDGIFNAIGTEDEPIEMYPGVGFENYAVEIFGYGIETLKYCNITNPLLGYHERIGERAVNLVDHCNLVQDPHRLTTRYLSNGVVYESDSVTYSQGLLVYQLTNSRLEGLRNEYLNYSQTPQPYRVYVNIMENCLINNCIVDLTCLNGSFCIDGYEFNNQTSFKNNVFMTGSISMREHNLTQSRLQLMEIHPNTSPAQRLTKDLLSFIKVDEIKESSTGTYLQLEMNPKINGGYTACPTKVCYDLLNSIGESLGGSMALIDDEDEIETLKGMGWYGNIGYYLDPLTYEYVSVKNHMDKFEITGEKEQFLLLYNDEIISSDDYFYYILEIPGKISEEEFMEAVNNFDYESWAKEYTNVTNNAFINPILNTNQHSWGVLNATKYYADAIPNYATNNYWGTENERLIDKMIMDADDYAGTYQDIIHEPILTLESESLADIYPFVTKVYLTDSDGNIVANVTPGEEYDVHVLFNRDMDMDTQPSISYGPAEPYTDYSVQGEFVSPREWVGKTKISPVLTSGTMYFRTKGGVAADDKWLECGEDILRFSFNVSTTGALAMMLNAEGGANKVELSWAQNDYEVLAGYNIYRSESPDGYFEKINLYLVTGNDYTDTDVRPGVTYYYYFKVVNTDGNEEENTSNIASAAPIDNIPPSLDHSPIESAKAGSSVTIYAMASDNIAVEKVTLYYRVRGSANFKSKNMTNSGDSNRYVAVIPAGDVTAAGVEYYIIVEDTDGNLNRSGSANIPHRIYVNSAPYISGITPSKIDIEGGRTVTILGGNFTEVNTLKIGGVTVDEFSIVDSGTITFVAPAMASGTYAVVVTDSEGRQANSPTPISYVDKSSAAEIPTNLTITSDIETVIPLYVTSNSDIISVHAEIDFPSADFVSVEAVLADPDSSALLDSTYENDTLIIGVIGTSNINPEDGALINIIVKASVDDEKQYEIKLHDVSFNGVEVTNVISCNAILKPCFTIKATVVYYSNLSAVKGAVIRADGVSGTTDENGEAEIIVNKKHVTITASSTNTDYAVSAYDASLVLQASVGKVDLDEFQILAADVDGNGKVNEYDAALILQMAVKKISSFPIGTAWIYTPVSIEKTLYSGENSVQFVAISVGDVDGSYRGE